MHSFLFWVNNNSMKRTINEIKELIKKYHIDVLVASNTLYLLILLIPLRQINYLEDFSLKSFIKLFNLGILFLINITFVAGKYLNNLKVTSDLIYDGVSKRKTFKERLKSFVLVILLLLFIVSLLIISFGLIKLWLNVMGSINFLFLKAIEFIVSLSIILLITMCIFKFSLPIFVEISDTLKISLVLTLLWVLLSTSYQFFVNLLKTFILGNVFNETILFIYFLYLLNYVIIISFVYYYVKIRKKQKSCIKNDKMA